MKEEKAFILDPFSQEYLAGKRPFPPEPSLGAQSRVGGIVVLLFSLLFAGGAAFAWGNAFPLLKEGRVIQGVYLGLTQEYTRVRKFQEVAVQFQTPEGKTVTLREKVRRAFLFQHDPQTPIAVRYLPQHPERAKIEEEFSGSQVRSAWYLTAGFVGMFLLGLWSWGNGWLIRWKHARLSRGCQVLDGEIVKAAGTHDRLGYLVTATFRFEASGGRTLMGKGRAYRGESPLPEPGTPVKVLYRDPKNFRLL